MKAAVRTKYGPPDAVRIEDMEKPAIKDGEVLIRGEVVMRGYRNLPDKTAETLDRDGWLATGDVGVLDDDGYLRIVDRKKELIITAGGENVSPANLEAALATLPLVGQACVVGDGQKFPAAIVTLDPDYAPEWAAEPELHFTCQLTRVECIFLAGDVERAAALADELVDRAPSKVARGVPGSVEGSG